MKQSLAALLLALCAAGCRVVEFHAETDVVKPSGFILRSVTGVEKSEGILHKGTLEYLGGGDLMESFQEYLGDMRRMKWTCTAENASQHKAAATLKKDTRACQVTFTQITDSINVVITMLPVK